jgi:hypothetical protein
MKNEKKILSEIKENLMSGLYDWNAFWSYIPNVVNVQNIEDDLFIEKVLVHLDIDDINKLFLLYPAKKIKNIWKSRLCVQEPYYHRLNCMLGSLYFDIKNPQRYIKTISNQHIKSIKNRADEWVSSTYGKNF